MQPIASISHSALQSNELIVPEEPTMVVGSLVLHSGGSSTTTDGHQQACLLGK